jgi:hypothetical protein
MATSKSGLVILLLAVLLLVLLLENDNVFVLRVL